MKSAIPSNPVGSNELGLAGEFTLLHEAIEHLGEQISELKARIDPILLPSEPTVAADSPTSPVQVECSSARLRVIDARNRLDILIEQVAGCLRRVDL